jgi:hypothetical protein
MCWKHLRRAIPNNVVTIVIEPTYYKKTYNPTYVPSSIRAPSMESL